MNTVNNYIAQVRHLAERNWIKAVSIAEEGIKAFPNEPLLYAELGYLYIQKENHKGAIEYFTKALKYAPDNNEYIFNLGTTYLKLEKFEESIKAYDRAKSYVPEILFNKTYAYRMTDNTEKEFECLKQMADNKYRKEEILAMFWRINLTLLMSFQTLQRKKALSPILLLCILMEMIWESYSPSVTILVLIKSCLKR
ncbi:MAG: tetratricopeptide repeat protein [Candidatus Cloacimonetes bacterium]|nr:tetratricopeptide repeat protein [Candidatus Cloacimonadota bacterium]MDD3501149.1 tetratricopeptide repeat protein [Candidatus Cloacimonadota bacterium]